MFLDGMMVVEYLENHGWDADKVGEYYKLVAINELLTIANEKMRSVLEKFADDENWLQGTEYGKYGIIFTNHWVNNDDPIQLANDVLGECEEPSPIYLERIIKLERAMIEIANELGVPTSDYPSPVVNAYNIAKSFIMTDLFNIK